MSQPGPLSSGKPSSAVVMAFAWTSGPGIWRWPVVDVSRMSWSEDADAPTTTTFPRTSSGSNLPFSTSMKLR